MDIKQYISSGIIEAWVLGLCTPEEEKELEGLRLQYPEIDRAVTDCENQLGKNLLQQSTLPGTETDNRILAALEKTNKTFGTVPANRVIPVNRWKKIAVAATVLLLLSAGLNFYFIRLSGRPAITEENTLPQRDYNIMKDPAITPVAMYGVATHSICRCTMYWDKKKHTMYIMIHHLPLSGTKRNYQLWALVNGKPVNAGVVRDEIRGRFIEVTNVPDNATSFIVTLEDAAGTDTPTESEIYLRGQI